MRLQTSPVLAGVAGQDPQGQSSVECDHVLGRTFFEVVKTMAVRGTQPPVILNPGFSATTNFLPSDIDVLLSGAYNVTGK